MCNKVNKNSKYIYLTYNGDVVLFFCPCLPKIEKCMTYNEKSARARVCVSARSMWFSKLDTAWPE